MRRSRALVIAWHRYHPHTGDTYRVLWEDWLRRFPLWAPEIDAFYLLDSDMNFTPEDRMELEKHCPKVTIIKKEQEGHHWVQFKTVLPHVIEEHMLFLDNDVVITKPGVINNWFRQLEAGVDFVGSFDGSGGLKEQIQSKVEYFKSANVTRMGSYYFLLTRTLLEKTGDVDWAPIQYTPGTYLPALDYTTVEGDWSDSFGLFTLKMLEVKARVYPIPDPRQSIYLQDDGTILKDPENPNDLGYYHIRNGNLANYIITSAEDDRWEDYNRELSSVKRELLRSLAWFDYMDQDKHKTLVYKVVIDCGHTMALWEEYMKQFKEYHNL